MYYYLNTLYLLHLSFKQQYIIQFVYLFMTLYLQLTNVLSVAQRLRLMLEFPAAMASVVIVVYSGIIRPMVLLIHLKLMLFVLHVEYM